MNNRSNEEADPKLLLDGNGNPIKTNNIMSDRMDEEQTTATGISIYV